MFWKNPAFTFAVLAALALGIGADTAIFSVVNAVLLKPLTYPDPDRIVQFLNTSREGDEFPGASATKFHIWQEQSSVFQDVHRLNARKGAPAIGCCWRHVPFQFANRVSSGFR
jgi:hypothetical protein